MVDPDKMSLLDQMWALFMNAPVLFILTFLSPIGGLIWLAWLARGSYEKKHRDTVDAQLALARDQVKDAKERMETAKIDNHELKEKLAQFISIDPQVLTIRDLANGTASAIDEALIANNELRSTLNQDFYFHIDPEGFKSWWDHISSALRKQMTWQDRISGCFGDKGGWFAVHPLDKKRAEQLIKEAKADGASWEDFEKEIEKYLNEHVTAKDGVREVLLTHARKTLRKMWGSR